VAVVLGVEEQNVFPPGTVNCPPGVHRYGPGNATDLCDMFHFWSRHYGGANWLCADGAVHYLGHHAANVLPALASRNGGDFTPVPD
jgi:hypothetical protein